MKEKKRIINDEIKAKAIQLINENWENLGEMNISEARQKAEEVELDLMKIWKRWDIVIVKMLDYWKYLYKQKKQEQKNKQKWKTPNLKTIRITFRIWDHDLEIRKRQAEKFANAWSTLKISLMLKWRENQYWNIAMRKIESFISSIEKIYKMDGGVKRNWNIFTAILKPINK